MTRDDDVFRVSNFFFFSERGVVVFLSRRVQTPEIGTPPSFA